MKQHPFLFINSELWYEGERANNIFLVPLNCSGTVWEFHACKAISLLSVRELYNPDQQYLICGITHLHDSGPNGPSSHADWVGWVLVADLIVVAAGFFMGMGHCIFLSHHCSSRFSSAHISKKVAFVILKFLPLLVIPGLQNSFLICTGFLSLEMAPVGAVAWFCHLPYPHTTSSATTKVPAAAAITSSAWWSSEWSPKHSYINHRCRKFFISCALYELG